MAYKHICDICNTNEADERYKIKRSRRGMWLRGNGYSKWDSTIWQPYQKIAMCHECKEKLLSNSGENL